MQYRIGTISVTNGSNVVNGVGTTWLANILVNQVGKPNPTLLVNGGSVVYTIAAVNSNTQLLLSVPYAGSTASGLNYSITKDFTANLGLAEINEGDRDWAVHLTEEVIRKVDVAVATGGGGSVDVSDKEDKSNKDTDAYLTANSDTKYPSQRAIKSYVDKKTTISLESYRGIGDGNSHTLTSLGITFSQAQAYWPLSYAGGLFNSGNFGSKENDWLALNEAILACGSGYRILLTKMFYIGSSPTIVSKPITIEGVSRWNCGLVAAASPYFTVITTSQYRVGTSPDYAGGFEGPAHSRFTNFRIKRNVKDWPNSASSIGLQIGDGGDGYSWSISVDHMVIENFGINLRVIDSGHGNYAHNRLYDFGVAGIKTDINSTVTSINPGLGNNLFLDNYVMGDSQLHVRNYSVYQGTTLETVFGGISRRPLSTKTAASYDLAMKNQVAAYWHKYGGGNKFIGNKAHITLNGFKIEFIDGIYMTGNATEFMIFRSIWCPFDASGTIFSQQNKATINANECSFGRPRTDYSYFGVTPVGILLDATNVAVANIAITSNVFPSAGAEQDANQNFTGIMFVGDSSSKFGGISIGHNTAHGLNIGVSVDPDLTPANCEIVYTAVNNDTIVTPSAHGYTDKIDANNCLSFSTVLASGTTGELQFADSTGGLNSTPTLKWSATDGTLQHYREDGVGYVGIFERNVDGTAGANHLFRKSRGSNSVPTYIFNGDTLGGLRVEGHDGSAYAVAGTSAFSTTQDWSTGNHGTKYELRTVGTGSTTNSLRMSIDGSGNATFTGSVTAASFSGPISSGTTGLLQLSNGSGGFSSDAAISYSNGILTLAKSGANTTTSRVWITDDSGFHVADISYNGTGTFANINTGVVDASSYKLNGTPITFGGGTVTSVTSANTDISVATTTTTPVLTLNSAVGGGADKIFKADSNGRLGIGTASPLRPFDFYGTTTTNAQGYIRDFQTTAAGGGGLYFLHNNATAGVSSGDRLGYYGFGFLNTSNNAQVSVLIESYAVGTGDDTHKGGELRFGTTPSGSNTRTERLRLTDYGTIRFIPMAQPSSAVEGDCYWDSTTHKLTCYTGSAWQAAW